MIVESNERTEGWWVLMVRGHGIRTTVHSLLKVTNSHLHKRHINNLHTADESRDDSRTPTNTPARTLVIARVLMTSQAHLQKNCAANEAMGATKAAIVSVHCHLQTPPV